MLVQPQKLFFFLFVVALVMAFTSELTVVYAAPTITVTTLSDVTGGPECTLRDAITAANSNTATGGCPAGVAGADVIEFSISGTISLASDLPTVTQALTIDGVGQAIVISGNHTNTGFGIENSAAFSLQNLTVTNHRLGLSAASGTQVNIADATFSSNSGTPSYNAVNGAAVYVASGATVNISNSTFYGNAVSTFAMWGNAGGAIFNAGTLTISNSTLTANSARCYGGAIHNSVTGSATLTNVTVSGNSTEADASMDCSAIRNEGALTARNTIIANTGVSVNCGGPVAIINSANNLDSGASCGFGSANGSLSSANPLLQALASNGGSTQTMALQGSSPAINAGSDAFCAAAPVNNLDQRGETRPVGAHCDIGAFEYLPSTWTVTKTADTSDGVCDTDCSLREAIAASSGGDSIIFDAALSGQTIYLGSTLTLSKNLTVDGSSLASQVIISGDTDNNGTRDVRVFSVDAGVTATLDSLTITKGNGTVGERGGGISNSGALTIINSLVTDNYAPYYAGGIYNNGGSLVIESSVLSFNTSSEAGGIFASGGSVTITDSELTQNVASSNAGGGLFNHNGAVTTIKNSAILSNGANGSGGGIYNGFASSLTLVNSTLAYNSAQDGGALHIGSGMASVINSSFSGNQAAGTGGGIYNYAGTLNFANTILANSGSGGDCRNAATIGVNTNNLVMEGGYHPSNNPNGCGAVAFSGDPQFGTLANHGGTTPTLALHVTSPAIDAGDDATCAVAPVNNLDQRGVLRPQSVHCDIGAFEYPDNGFNEAPTITSSAGRLVFENTPAHYTFTVQAEDPDINTSLAFSIIGGSDAARFSIHAGSGALSFIAAPNFEVPLDADADNEYVVTVEVSDGELTDSQTFFIDVVNTNDAPTGISLNNPSVAENQPSQTILGALTTSDEDSSDAHTYSFCGGADDASFQIVLGNQIRTAAVFDFETKNSYSICVRSNDNASGVYPNLSFDETFTITVGDVNEGAGATTWTVTKTADTSDGVCAADCSLREALFAADDGDTIVFHASLSGQVIYLGSTLEILKGVTIDGSSLASKITLSGDTGNNGTRDVRIFYNASTAPATLQSLIITNGNASGAKIDGGGIYNEGSLTVNNCVITQNTASGSGGGIFSEDGLVITNSLVSGNTAANGGGISSFGSLQLNGSTLSGNIAASKGGGIHSLLGSGNVTNSTISGNTAGTGGGIYHDEAQLFRSFQIKNSTISGNTAATTGGVWGVGYTNTIIANSTGGDCFDGAPAGASPNLVEDASCDSSLTGDPKLDVLANYGGATDTLALLPDSPAIDAGDDAICAAAPINGLDQREITRDKGLHCDLGAYEAIDITPPTVVSVTRGDPDPTSATSVNFTVTFSELVNGLDAADLAFTKTGSITDFSVTSISPVSGPAKTYTISVATGNYNGTLRLDMLNDGSILDVSNNPLAAGYAAGEVYTVTKLYTATIKSTNSQDGWILESGENTNAGGSLNAAATTIRLGDDAARKQYRGILSFATGANIPDNAIITKVTLKVKVQGIQGGGNPLTMFQGFMVDVRKSIFGKLAGLENNDFQAAPTTGYHVYGPFTPTLTSNWYAITLSNASVYINKLATGNGLTQLRLRFNLGDNNNSVANYLNIYSGDAGATVRPQLVIEYQVP